MVIHKLEIRDITKENLEKYKCEKIKEIEVLDYRNAEQIMKNSELVKRLRETCNNLIDLKRYIKLLR